MYIYTRNVITWAKQKPRPQLLHAKAKNSLLPFGHSFTYNCAEMLGRKGEGGIPKKKKKNSIHFLMECFMKNIAMD